MTSMVAKKKTLIMDTGIDYSIIGISWQLSDYRLVHYLNKLKIFNFIRLEEFEFYPKSSEISQKFPLYMFDDKENYTLYYLLSNRSEDGILVNDWKIFDYLLISRNYLNDEKLKKWISQIKKIQGVLVVKNLQITKKEETDSLLSDIELYVMDYQLKIKTENMKINPK